MKLLVYRTILWCCLSVLLIRCHQPDTGETKASTTEKKASTQVDYEEATKNMAATIAKAFASVDPSKASFLAENERIEMFKDKLQDPDPHTRIVAWSYYAYELLSAGKTEQAITEFQAVLNEYKKFNVNEETLHDFNRFLAIAYLRLGEQANCINTRNVASCILPIAPEGQYTMTQGSEAAIQKCLEILKQYPDDAETMYVLNIAAMTIGKYPSAVPDKWRLPESSFAGGAHFEKFVDISQKVGITGTSLAGGVCIEDFDGDGWLDILTSSWGKTDPLILWKNTGNGHFVDASSALGLEGINGGLNMVHADINNDGLPDVLVLRGAWMRDQGAIPNSLLLNLGNFKFADITKSAGVLTFAATQTATFADFNLDGWIDFFVGNESGPNYPYPHELYLNNKDNTFRNVINEIGDMPTGFIKGCIAGDINNDGWPDIYISRLPGANLLLLNKGVNENGVPQFVNIAKPSGVEEPLLSFPTWFWDYDNDGWDDIFVSSYGDGIGDLTAARDFMLNAKGEKLNGTPRVYHNNGNKTFTDVTTAMGMNANAYTMGCNFGDLDNDGYQDFYLGTGAPEYSSIVPNKMYRNNAGKHFDDITAAGGFGQVQKGHAVAFGDLDHDGDEDLFESLGGAFCGDVYEDVLFANPIGQDNSWIVLQLVGVQSNRMAIGARVKITVDSPTGTHTFYRRVNTGGSFGSSSLQLEVGLGNATAVKEVEITWPVLAQTKQVFHDLPIKKYVRITEGNDTPEYPEITAVQF